MYDRMQTLTAENLNWIHDRSIEILSDTGIAFNDDGSLELFGKHGFSVDGKVVRFNENQVQEALSLTPSRFQLIARDPEKSCWVGEDDWVYVPTYGPPFLVD